MGCFSFLCKECQQPINSSSFDGDSVHLFLLKNGKVIEHMHGNYDSYGHVFTSPKFEKSFNWKISWDDVCNLMFNDNEKDGIAVMHSMCYNGTPPKTKSLDDPDQGWGDSMRKFTKVVEEPFHKIF